MVISQKPGLRRVTKISEKRNSSEEEFLSSTICPFLSNLRSMTQKTRNDNKPMIRKANATNNGVESVKWRAIGAEILKAAAVPKRAIANWIPIAKASS